MIGQKGKHINNYVCPLGLAVMMIENSRFQISNTRYEI